MNLTRTLAALGAGALLASSVVLAVAPPANAATLTPDQITARAIADASAQQQAQTYDVPAHKPIWKVLFLGFTNRTKADSPNAPEIMDEKDRQYLRTIADNFKQAIEEVAYVTIMPTVKFETEPITTPAGEPRIHENRVSDMVKRHAAMAEYDNIIALSKGNNGGVAMRGYSDTLTQGSYYSYVSLWRPGPQYPQQSQKYEYSAEMAWHEFAHTHQFGTPRYPYPDLHSPAQFGYTDAPLWYTDYLTGKVKVSGKNEGTFPKMWSTGPRFLHNPAMVTVHFQDQSGRTVAPSVDTYGPAGDPYAVRARLLPGYRGVSVKAGSAPATGTFSSTSTPEVTFVYSAVGPTVTFSGGETTDLVNVWTREPGTSYTHQFHYRSSVPVTAFSYTDSLDLNDGGTREDRFAGQPISWDYAGVARVVKDGNTYTIAKTSATRVTVSVELASPQTVFTMYGMGYVNASSTARIHQSWDLVDLTPQLTGVKEPQNTEPRAYVTVTWGKHVTKVTFLGGETTDLNNVWGRTPGAPFTHQFVYRASEAVTAFTYTDTLLSNDGATRQDTFAGQPITWNGSTAQVVKDGDTFTLTKTSATQVTVSVKLGSPKTTFTLYGMGYVNAGPTARTRELWDLVDLTPASTGTAESLNTHPRAYATVTWGDHRPTITTRDTGDKDQILTRQVSAGAVFSDAGVYNSSEPISAISYTVSTAADSGATIADVFRGTPIVWNAGKATYTNGDHLFTFTRLSETAVRVDIALAAPMTSSIVLDGPGFVSSGPTARGTITWDILTVTPVSTGKAEDVRSEPVVARLVTWGNHTTTVRIYDTGDQDQTLSRALNPGQRFTDHALYTTGEAIESAAYTVTSSGRGAGIDDTFMGKPITWDGSSRATVTDANGTYTLTRLSDTSVRIDVVLAGPQRDRIRLDGVGFVNTDPTAQVTVRWDVLAVAPVSTHSSENITTEPVVSRVVTWAPSPDVPVISPAAGLALAALLAAGSGVLAVRRRTSASAG